VSEDVILTPHEAQDLGERALQTVGYTSEESRIIAAHLVDAGLCGYRFASLPRVLTINEEPMTHMERSPIKVVHETEISAMLDGNNHTGYYAVYKAMELAIEKAKKSRIAIVGIHRTHLSGRNAYYLEHIARAGFVGLHMGSGPPIVLPHGGAKPALGTNPIAFSFPMEPDPFIIDFGTAAIMRGEVIFRTRIGQDLPPDCAIDANGNPTIDPNEALKGGIYTFGGHRGGALSLGIQAMCLLAGAAIPNGNPQDWGFMFMVFDPEIMMPKAQFGEHLRGLIEAVRAVPPLKEGEPVRIPSERAFATRRRLMKEGIPLAREVHTKLVALAEKAPQSARR
jgi:LDH2 family malate/lactate/ureidoglycolate dehydrogenase